MDEFKSSPEFQASIDEVVLPFYSSDINHVLRMAVGSSVFGLSRVDGPMVLADQFCEAARQSLPVVPYTEDELGDMKKNNAEQGKDLWVPPPLLPRNLLTVITEEKSKES